MKSIRSAKPKRAVGGGNTPDGIHFKSLDLVHSKLLFCRVAVHSGACYRERVALITEGRFNKEWLVAKGRHAGSRNSRRQRISIEVYSLGMAIYTLPTFQDYGPRKVVSRLD
jgi:hypothetical protein